MDSLKGLADISFADSLKDVGIHVVDIETTGLLLNKDRAFSAAAQSYTIDNNTLSSPDTTEGFFNVIKNKNLKKPTAFKDKEEYVTYLEQQLRNAHSDKNFGQEQLERGSLRDVATAYADAKTSTPEDFLKNLNTKLSSNTSNILLTHNSSFESSVFDSIRKRSKDSSIFSELQEKNLHNTITPFKVSSNLVDKDKGLVNKARDEYYKNVLHYASNGSQEQLRESLGQYASKNVDVINRITEEIRGAKQAGKTVALDSMHLSRALMAFGAVNGTVDVHNLMAGDSVAQQVQYFLNGEKELHTATGDSNQQGRLFKIFTDELDKYKQDSSYKSDLFKGYNEFLNKNQTELGNIKKSLYREAQHVITGEKEELSFYDWKESLQKRVNILPDQQQKEANQYLRNFTDTFENRASDTDEALKQLNSFESAFTPKDIRSSARTSVEHKLNGFVDSLNTRKKGIALIGALAATNLLIGGGEKGKDKRANTYDELYNNVYYGSPLADWQERNNSHKVLY